MAAIEETFDRVRRKMVTARIEFMSQLATFCKEELAASGDEKSPIYISHLLYIIDGLALEQMQRVQQEDDPLLENFAERVPAVVSEVPAPRSLESVLAGMAARREDMFGYLASLSSDAWERPFHQQEWGTRKFYQLVSMLPLYDQQHTRQLVALKEQYPTA
ncbi:MAG: hypothetical protein H0U76_25905 [Ktedonobacteraceae bacterium]|nr:hypothetical protein [Ktedonobacteraceae bacterium]